MAWDDIDTDEPPCPAADQPLVDDVDEIAVERAVASDGIHYADLTTAEQAEIIRRLTVRGRSIRGIDAQLATTTRSVSQPRPAVGRQHCDESTCTPGSFRGS